MGRVIVAGGFGGAVEDAVDLAALRGADDEAARVFGPSGRGGVGKCTSSGGGGEEEWR